MPRTRRTTPPIRRFGLAVATLATAFGVSSCQVASPITTDMQYDPADGVSVETEDMDVLDLVIISEGEGAPGVVSGYVVNTSDEPLTVNVALEAEGERADLAPAVEVNPSRGVRMDGRTDDGAFVDPVLADAVPGFPGGLVTLRFSTGQSAVSARVPVLPPDGVYEPYVEVLAQAD
ncbi:MAG: hypothetical protein WBG89_00430 [Ornithinimicrobium sp.]